MQGRKNPQRSFLDAGIEKQARRPGFLDRVEAMMDRSVLEPYRSCTARPASLLMLR